MWFTRILSLGAAAVGAAAIPVCAPTAPPAHAEPCAPAVVPAPGCTPVGPPPIESPGAAEAGPPPNPCNDLGYFFANQAVCMDPEPAATP
jgi:hypothetical protein